MAGDKIGPPLQGDFIARHHDLAMKHFAGDLDDQAVVLKAHLLLEGMFRDCCSASVPAPEHLQGARLTFKQISLLTRALDPSNKASTAWLAVNHLNSLRNAMAHELEPSAERIAKLKRLIITAAETQSGTPGIYTLMMAVGFLCGFMSAHLQYMIEPSCIDNDEKTA